MTHDLIDFFVFHGRWPQAGNQLYLAKELKEMLSSAGIARAVVSSYDHVLRTDHTAINMRMINDLTDDPFFLPLAGHNPSLPEHKQEITKMHSSSAFAGIILHPWTHGYQLDTPEVIDLCGQYPSFICTAIEYLRAAPDTLSVRSIPPDEIIRFLNAKDSTFPTVILGLRYHEIVTIAASVQHIGTTVFFDIANADGGLQAKDSDIPGGIFGTLAPRYLPQGAIRTLEHMGASTRRTILQNTMKLHDLLD